MKKVFLVLAFVMGIGGVAYGQTGVHTPITLNLCPATAPTPEYIKIQLPTADYVLIRKTNIVKLNVFFHYSWKVEIYVAETKWKEKGRGSALERNTTLQPLLTKTFLPQVGNNNMVVPAAVIAFVNAIIPASNITTIP